MTPQDYSVRALALASDFNPVLHAAMGISTESGEIMDLVKREMAYGKMIDIDHMIEEAGDLCWYLNLMIIAMGTTWDEVMARNINKLETRYPEKAFRADRALNRDTAAEQAAMVGQ